MSKQEFDGYYQVDWNQFIRTEKETHHAWKGQQRIKELGIELHNLIGKTWYRFKTPKGEVSMVRLHEPDYENLTEPITWKWSWEIYSFNKLFEDTERYDTWKECRERIKEVLSPDLDW